MNIKRTFGAILTLLGIIGLIYAGVTIINKSAAATSITVFAIIGLLFFFSGISLVKTVKDEA
jgi:uncharacterized membrane protein